MSDPNRAVAPRSQAAQIASRSAAERSEKSAMIDAKPR